jgi:uncharacterized membrane-anchored protein
MENSQKVLFSKVPEVTLIFWITKIFATTLGETGGDSVSMSMNLGYLVGTGIFAVIFIAMVLFQIRAKCFHPVLYWTTIIATTTVGTTMADFADRSLGIGYAGGTSILLSLVVVSLLVWYWSMGTISIDSVSTVKAEVFYWITIMFSQTLGTALGDWMADNAGFGYRGSAIVFTAMLVIVALLHFKTKISRPVLFWSAFVLTRPLGAVVGDFLDKPINHGGLAMSRYTASAVIFGLIALSIIFFPQKAARQGAQHGR